MIELKYIERFLSNIKIFEGSDCWIWDGKRHNNIGVFNVSTKQYSVKTFSYIIYLNDQKNMYRPSIVQMCNNKFCVKPEHLRLHGLTNTREHKIYEDMTIRIINPNHPWYPHYGGRGIDMDPRYHPDLNLKGVGFINFYDDLKDLNLLPIPNNLSLDRIDNNKGYWKDNLRLATSEEQSQNNRRNIFTPQDIKYIREKYAQLPDKSTIYKLSKLYNTTSQYIKHVINKKHWKNI